jgi:hypothetical protein
MQRTVPDGLTPLAGRDDAPELVVNKKEVSRCFPDFITSR